MNMRELRRVSEEAARLRAEEQRQNAEALADAEQQRKQQSWEEEWTRARAAVTYIDDRVRGAAQCGIRSTEVYCASGEFVRIWESWTGSLKYDVPEYAQFVYKYCRKQGLHPKWRVVVGSSSCTYWTPSSINLVVSW